MRAPLTPAALAPVGSLRPGDEPPTDETPTIWLRTFQTTDRCCYAAYRRLKYEVFVAEQGWSALADRPADRIANEEHLDSAGRLWLAETVDGNAVGIVRVLPLSGGFPHRELFHQHLPVIEGRGSPGDLATLNALAVRCDYRRRRCRVDGAAWRGTVGKLLVLAAAADLQHDGFLGIIATAGSRESLRLFRALGFRVLDAPVRTGLHPDFWLTNVGLALGSPASARAQHEHGFAVPDPRKDPGLPTLMDYFERCERAALPVPG